MAERRSDTRIGHSWRPPATPLPPSEDTTAAGRLRRLLHVLPAAYREGGIPLANLAADLGVSEATVAADLRDVRERCYHHPGGSGFEIQVDIRDDRVHVWTSGVLRRPTRLSAEEASALAFGLRMAGLSPSLGPDPDRREALRRRLESGLAAQPQSDPGPPMDAAELAADPAGVRETLATAARDGRPCRIEYLKEGGRRPEVRTVYPWALITAEGRWYAASFCERAADVRRFRVDRILSATLLDGSAPEPPPGFDPAGALEDGRVLDADGAPQAAVRYTPHVARLVAEREEGEWTEDGGYVVRHPVLEEDWLVRHVLGYGGDAEVLEPEGLRALVRERASRLAGAAAR